MTLDNMTGITEGSYTGFCKSQLITCNRVKECNGVCPFEDALKHADKEMDEVMVETHKTLKNAQAAVDAMNHRNEYELAIGCGFPHGVPAYEIR